MLSANDKKVLVGMLPQMATIINAVPGEAYTNGDVDPLLIMQRRLMECDLKKALSQYNEIFAKQSGTGIADITNSMIAFVQIKVLVESGIDEFDGTAYRELFKECKGQIARTNNIIRLTKASSMTAENYQKERIELTLRKNDAFIVALENEMSLVEKKLERFPKAEEEPVAEESKPEKIIIKPVERKSILNRLDEMIQFKKGKQVIDERLREEEKKNAITGCEEIPYYDRKLVFTESVVCKDIPAYTLLKRKHNIYFGLSKNVGKNNYDNSDESLVELTKASEEFIQFMTADLLNDEYSLKIFTSDEKVAMQMYFDFMTRCFEKHIGVTLTVREYLNFKVYYNKLVSMMMDLEQQQKEDYYKALILADRYSCYMKCYGLECADTRDDVIEQIVKEQSNSYVEDIQLIIDNHVVDVGAKEDMESLINDLEHFHDEEEIQEKPEEVCEVVDPIPTEVSNGVTKNFMQIVIQLLDTKHEVIDEALYAGTNIQQALYDYERKDACIKRLGFRNNGVDVFYKEEVSK